MHDVIWWLWLWTMPIWIILGLALIVAFWASSILVLLAAVEGVVRFVRWCRG